MSTPREIRVQRRAAMSQVPDPAAADPAAHEQQSGAPYLQAAAQALQHLPVNAIIALFQSMILPSAGPPAPAFSGLAQHRHSVANVQRCPIG
jgi:hypothetical protein